MHASAMTQALFSARTYEDVELPSYRHGNAWRRVRGGLPGDPVVLTQRGTHEEAMHAPLQPWHSEGATL